MTGRSYEREDWSVYANIADLAQIIAIGGGIAFLGFGIAALVRHSARQEREARQSTRVP